MPSNTFLWHDYETFGSETRRDRPAQFAAIRTDAELNNIGEEVMLYCQPAPDFLPDPVACLITGITPQQCLEKGVPEVDFARRIASLFSEPDTIGVGYNTIRFDDEITRFLFWRNLMDPYAREWQNGCGRWDILDMLRATYAFRPEGLHWPKNDEGVTSFKLEHLSKANGLHHEAAHDALSDVRATIALARLIKERHPKLFDFCLSLHKKDKVLEQIGLSMGQPTHAFLHVSGMFDVRQGCLAVMWPLGVHPTNKNEVLAWDLAHDPAELFTLYNNDPQAAADTVRQRLFTKTADLPEGVTRLPLKSIHINKSPIVLRHLKTLSPERAQQWEIDLDRALHHAQRCVTLAKTSDLTPLWQQVFTRPASACMTDVDEALYNGFIGPEDRKRLTSTLACTPEQLADRHTRFDDPRLDELVFRYRARNFPSSLTSTEQARWHTYRQSRLCEGHAGARTLAQFSSEIDALYETTDERGQDVLSTLVDYAEMIAP